MIHFKSAAGATLLILALGVPAIAGQASSSPAQGPTLKSSPPPATSPAASRFRTADASAAGKTLYAANCAACHGATGQGGIGPAVGGKSAGSISAAIAKSPMMASLSSLSGAELAAIAAYLQAP